MALLVGTPLYCICRWLNRVGDYDYPSSTWGKVCELLFVKLPIVIALPFLCAFLVLSQPFLAIVRVAEEREKLWWQNSRGVRLGVFKYADKDDSVVEIYRASF